MRSSLVLTIIGADRTGLVESIAQAVAAHGGNWVESRMARLAGQFAGILLVDVAEQRQAALTAALRDLEGRGLHVTIAADIDAAAPAAGAGAAPPATTAASAGRVRPLRFELVGQDRPGIVRDISHVLAQRGVSVVELQTRVTSAPMTGEPLFRACASLQAPSGESLDEVRDALEAIANDLMVDITFDDQITPASP